MWKALSGQLANPKRRLTLYNWPEITGFPHSSTSNKGLADLSSDKRVALFRATNHPEFPLSKREWPEGGKSFNRMSRIC